MSNLVEDVHIHAPASEVFARIEATGGWSEWLPRCFRGAEGDGAGGLACTLALPLRAEPLRLEAARSEPPSLLHFRSAAGGGAFSSLTWSLSDEGPRNAHLELRAVYEPSGGFPGAVLDALLLRPARRQALRDALWRLKQLLEGRAPRHPAPPPGGGA